MQKETHHIDEYDVIQIGNSAGEGMVMHEQVLRSSTLQKSGYNPVAAIHSAETEGFPHGHIVLLDLSLVSPRR